MLDPNSDCIDNDSNSDNDMTANEDITQKIDNFLPVRRWIRGHYTKLTSNNETKCNHCNVKITIHKNQSLAFLHTHLVKRHSDKLIEEQTKEDKFHWIWDYFIAESDTQATCKQCDFTIKYSSTTNLKKHLNRHKIFGPNSDCTDNNSNLDIDMTANEDITQKTDNFIPVRRWIRGHYTKLTSSNKTKCNHCSKKFTIHKNQFLDFLHKHLVKTHPDILIEEEKKEDKFHWTWDYFIAESNTQAKCKQCALTIKYYSITNLKSHLKHHKILGPNSDCTDNDSNSDNDMTANEDITQKIDNFIPVRSWICEHYTKLTSNKARCKHCNAKFIIHNRLDTFHKHLVKTHPYILTEKEKKEDKFHWTWDYFIAESDTQAICKQCDLTIKYRSTANLKKHLKRHKILGSNSDYVDNESNSDNDMPANEDMTLKTDNFIPVPN
ncbi:PREDICTED: uncharacterized protein LOC108753169 [Trachymyrmex septentrionalis]|uniref:uncharacterized protein LOC108753169 n=1 Tax=Trachymyrmex septentrionalis TaxID=34720 RepID=UPI00084F20C8|nr:PREDICTED: uncharacterized protein LOC108753169 [Trachymyrmex septentrionalis]